MQGELESGKDSLKVALLLFCITVIYFFPVIFSHQTFASRDLYAFFYPRRFFAAEAIRSGVFPLWNPHLASGVPFLANLQSSLLYPLSVIYYVLPFSIGFKYFIILHYYLAGFFMYLLMKYWRYETSSSITASIVFMFGGYMISILDNLAFLTAAVWLPLIVLFFDRSLRKNNPNDPIITGVLISLQILGGDASCYILSTFIFMVAYLIYYLISGKDLGKRERITVICSLLVAWIVALGLSSIQIIPFLEFVSHSTRIEGFGYENLTKWSYNPLELFQFLVPYLFGSTVPMCRWFGQYWLDTFYIGIFPLLLVIFCICWAKCTLNLFLLFIISASLFMAFGRHNPVFCWFTSVPGINMLHYPVKYLFLAGFALSLLAGMGFSSLFARLKQGKQIKAFFLFLFVVNLIMLAVLFTGLIMEDRLFASFKDIYPQTLFHTIAGVESSFLAIFTGYSWFVILLATVSVLLVLVLRGRIPLRVAKALFIVLVLADLMFLGKPGDPIIESSLYSKPSETVKVMRSDQSHFRIFSLSYITFDGFMHMPETPFSSVFTTLKSFMVPNLPLLFHIDTVDEYAALLAKRYYALFYPVKEFFRRGEKKSWQMEYSKKILNLLNVKYVISSFSLEDKGFVLVQDGKVKLYENPGVLPRAYLVPEAMVVKDDEEVLKILEEVHFDPGESVLITRGEYEKVENAFNKENGLLPNSFKGKAKILKYSPNQVEIETNGNDSSFLVLADNFYPGWTVYVNGSEKNVLQVNYNLKGVFVPPGKQKVTFKFVPRSFKIGASITLFTIIACIVFLGLRKAKRTQPACSQ